MTARDHIGQRTRGGHGGVRRLGPVRRADRRQSTTPPEFRRADIWIGTCVGVHGGRSTHAWVKEKRPSGRSAPAQRWDAFSCGGHAGCDRRRSRARRARPPGARRLSGRVRLVELHREFLECLRAQEAGTEESAEVFSALAGVGRQLAGESENVARGGAARAPERTDRLRVGDEAPPGEEEYRPDIASHGQARQPAGKRPPRRRLGLRQPGTGRRR